jgi:hypothetical protein
MTLTFEERLGRLAETDINMERIRVIERCFGGDNIEVLARPGRALVGEGILIKECRKKPKPRYFFLFNDILVYGTSVINKKKYINQHIIPLDNVQIKSINDTTNPKLRNGWMIMSPKKTFCVYATTSKEKIEWMTHLSNCIEKLTMTSKNRIVTIAPMWIPDKEADTCMRCNTAKFNMVNRRHHCRNCGFVVCKECSKNKFLLAGQSEEPLRVCNTCYAQLTQIMNQQQQQQQQQKQQQQQSQTQDENSNSNSNSNNKNKNNNIHNSLNTDSSGEESGDDGLALNLQQDHQQSTHFYPTEDKY